MNKKLFDFVDLHTGEESKERVLEDVVANISFRNSMGRHRINPGTDSAKSTTVVVYSAKRWVDLSEIERMQKWLELKMKTTDIVLVGKD
jgi:hypothetical protein